MQNDDNKFCNRLQKGIDSLKAPAQSFARVLVDRLVIRCRRKRTLIRLAITLRQKMALRGSGMNSMVSRHQ